MSAASEHYGRLAAEARTAEASTTLLSSTPAWVFTFGAGQRLRSTNREGRSRLEGFGKHLGIGFRLDNRYVRIAGEHQEARAAMVAIFGQVWSSAYFAGPEADAMIAKYELVELDISGPLAELEHEAARNAYVNPGDDTVNGSWST